MGLNTNEQQISHETCCSNLSKFQSITYSQSSLEMESRLQSHGSRSKGSSILPEIAGLNIVGDAAAVGRPARLEVQVIEQIEGIGANLDGRALAHSFDSTQ